MRLVLLLLVAAYPAAAQSDDPAIPGLGAKVTRVRFFEGPRTPPSLRDRVYAARFDSAAVRSVYVEVGLSYPPAKEAVSLKLDCGFTGPGGAPAGTATVPVEADAGWELSVHAGGTGTDTPGSWKAGAYQVACRYNNKVIGTGTFEISRPAAAPAPPPPPPPPASKPSGKQPKQPERPATPFITLKAKVTAIRLFESAGGEVPDPKARVITTSFDALTARVINLELELEYPKAARKVEFELPCQIEGPDSAPRTPSIKATIEPGWTGSYHSTGWGARDRGGWPEGDYRVTCRDQGQTVATTEFKVIKARAAVEALGGALTHLKLFQSSAERLPVEPRLYGARFDGRQAKWIMTEFGLVYPAVAAPVQFGVECVYTFPDGTQHPVSVGRRVPAGWTGSVHAQGVGFDQPGHFPAGTYKVSCRSDEREFAAGTFEVFDGSAPPASTQGGGLRFFARNNGAPAGPPTYVVTLESGTFDTLFTEATMPQRAAGDSTAFRCDVTDPAGLTSAFTVPGEVRDRNLIGAARMHTLDAPKMRGTYRVECRVGTRAVTSDRFDLVGKPDLPAVDAKLLGWAVYEGTDVMPDDEAVPDVAFSAARIRSLWVEALLDHPTDTGTALVYSCKILTGRAATLSDTGPQRLQLAPGDRSILLRQRLVPSGRQKWAAGKYLLTCTSDKVAFLKIPLELTR